MFVGLLYIIVSLCMVQKTKNKQKKIYIYIYISFPVYVINLKALTNKDCVFTNFIKVIGPHLEMKQVVQ